MAYVALTSSGVSPSRDKSCCRGSSCQISFSSKRNVRETCCSTGVWPSRLSKIPAVSRSRHIPWTVEAAVFLKRQRKIHGFDLLLTSLGSPTSPKQCMSGGQLTNGNGRTLPQVGSMRKASNSPFSACLTQERCRKRPSSTSSGRRVRNSSSAMLAQDDLLSPVMARNGAANDVAQPAAVPRASRAQNSSLRKLPFESLVATLRSKSSTARRPLSAPASPTASATSRSGSK
mmetsp:Transcript_17002/g.39679  ORF Transcript_17002/g.39679 Transcript_17002/m.39679 type:complete len:231 (+) Transcript_17002:1029-1721(+)